MTTLAIFASGKGSNAQKIIGHFQNHPKIKIGLVVSSHKEAGVLSVAREAGVPYLVLDRKSYYGSGESLIKKLKDHKISGVVLAGFLWLVPEYLITLFDKKIINIHPALLPKYGGKGMWGMHVHESVWKNHDKTSGITIHEVNQQYDQGKIIFQANCTIEKSDTPIDIAGKVHQLEYQHYPAVIETYFSH